MRVVDGTLSIFSFVFAFAYGPAFQARSTTALRMGRVEARQRARDWRAGQVSSGWVLMCVCACLYVLTVEGMSLNGCSDDVRLSCPKHLLIKEVASQTGASIDTWDSSD